MKKITLLLLIILPLLGFGQTTIENYTFDPSSTDGWVSGNSATVAYDGTNYYTAAGSLNLTTTATNKVAKVNFSITETGDYTVKFKIKGPDGNVKGIINQGSNDPGTAILMSTLPSSSGGDGTTWYEYSYTWTLTSLTAPQLQIQGAAIGTYYIDDVTVVREACVGYAITVETDGGGTNEITTVLPCYPEASSVEFTATPSCGDFTFAQWEIDGTLSGISTNPYTYTVGTADATIKAIFTATSTPPDTNFDTDAELSNWIATSNSTATTSGDNLTWTITGTSPKIKYDACSFAPETWNINALKIGYSNETANTRLRFVHPKDGGLTYINYDGLATGDATTPGIGVIDKPLTHGTWLDFLTSIEFFIKSDTANGDAVNGNFVIDYIKFYDSTVDPSEKNTYDFAADDITGFSPITGTISDSGTTLDFNGNGTATVPKLFQDFFTVDAASNKYLLIEVDDNASNADEFSFYFTDAVSSTVFYGWEPLNSATPTTLLVDLTRTEWDGDISEWFLRFRNNGGASVDTGLIKISQISFLSTPPPTQTIAAGNWNLDATWLYGVPFDTQNVTIDNAITIATDANATINDLTVGTGSLTISSGGSLIVNGASSGDITYNRNLGTSNWYTVSSPFVGQDVDAFVAASVLQEGTGTGNDNLGLGTYNTLTNTWTYYQDGASGSGNFIDGQGYTVNLAGTGDVSFKGTMNVDDESIALTTTGLRYNLLGNPYPSYINSGTLLSTILGSGGSLETETLWIWDESANAGAGGYATYVSGAAFQLAPGQGFFVQSSVAGGDVHINEAFQSHQSDTFLRSATRPEVYFTLSDGSNTRDCKLYYIDGTTTGFDNGYDGPMFGGVSNSFAIFTHAVANGLGRDLAIQSLPDNDYENLVVPVGINAASGTEITISASSVNLPTGIEIYLEDKDTSTFTLLNVASDFTTTLTGDLSGIGRFYLHTTSSALSVNDNSLSYNLQVYTTTNPKELIVKGQLSGATTADLYDLQGRLILSNKLDRYSTKNTIDISSISTGIYVVKVDNGNQTKTQKVIVK